jgi:Mlc titration factor MtfA (ptsG expression regulator)
MVPMNRVVIIYLLSLAAFFVLLGVFYFLRRHFKTKRRALWRRLPFPADWKKILLKNVSLYRRLPEPLRKELHGHINVFLREKSFEGCRGLKITDEVRVIIAAQACLLLLNKRPTYYPKLSAVLVYPHPYITKEHTPIDNQYLSEEIENLGESWEWGIVVLAWDQIKEDAQGEDEGNNLVIHEFAHQLDVEEHQWASGVPKLADASKYQKWSKVFKTEFEELRHEIDSEMETLIDEYGATDPAEFFAVASEIFFMRSSELKKEHSDLYEVLKDFYRLDPAKWGE